MPQIMSPAAIARVLVRPLPLLPLNHLLSLITRHLCHRHQAVVRRLQPIVGHHFLITPDGSDISFFLEIHPHRVTATATRNSRLPADVRISGNLVRLLQMLEGSLDGDALFFSREISIEGDTEALLTLRNAIDSEDIDLRAEVLSACGPWAGPAARLLDAGASLWARLGGGTGFLNGSPAR